MRSFASLQDEVRARLRRVCCFFDKNGSAPRADALGYLRLSLREGGTWFLERSGAVCGMSELMH